MKEIVKDVMQELQSRGVRFLYLQFVDLNGMFYSITIPTERLEDAVKTGVGIDGYSCGFLDVEKSDLIIKPDLDTVKVMPWETSTGKVATCMCDIYDADGETPYPLAPRNVLKESLRKLKDEMGQGADFMVSPELQFWVMEERDGKLELYDEARYFSAPPVDKGTELRQEFAVALDEVGIPTDKSHHETTPGKYELNIDYGSALKIADTMYQYKFIVKNLAARHGLIVSFMAKPFGDRAGNGMHFHQNLVMDGKNLFSDPHSDYFNLSDMALSFIAGQLEHAPSLVSITNPTVNSYKRFHQLKGTEAPSYVLWAQYNRTSLLRVPPAPVKAARFEFRGGDGSMNPYLGFAAFLSVGMDGIRRKLTPPEPVEENVHTLTAEQRKEKQIGDLPWNFGEALENLENDDVLKEALGDAYERYLYLKKKDWQEYGRVVTQWERDKYLDV